MKKKRFKQHLLLLEGALEPKDLREQIIAYFLSDATGTDVFYALLKEDEEGSAYEKSLLHYEKLGSKLATDGLIMKMLLPSLLQKDNTNTFFLGRGMWLGAVEKTNIWKDLLKQYLLLPDELRYYHILRGWINGAYRDGEDTSDRILDEVANVSELKHLLLPLQSAVPVTTNGLIHLKRAVKNLEIDSKEFQFLAYSTFNSAKPTEDLTNIIEDIINRTDAKEVALEILFGKCNDVNSGSADGITEKLLSIGRQFLLSLDLGSDLTYNNSYNVSTIIQICFAGRGAFDAASEFAIKLMRLLRGKYRSIHGFDRILRQLVAVQPISMLNTLLERGMKDDDFDWIKFRRDSELYGTFLSHLPDDLILDWCKADTDHRYKIIGGALICYALNEETGKLTWKPIFWKLVESAPSLTDLLEGIEDTLELSVVHGSRANAYEARLPLFSELFDNSGAELSAWARSRHKRWIEEVARARRFEAERNKIQNVAFE